MTFGEQLQAAIVHKGLTAQDFPITPERRYFVPPEEIPLGLQHQMEDTLTLYADRQIALPFFHITPRAIRLPNGTVVDTNFVSNMRQNGARKNLNVAGLVVRTPEGAQLATPTSILHRPEIFVDDIHLILDRYNHHGIRTNRTQHGDMRSDHFTNIGIPTMVLLSKSGRIKRGIDGDEHYVFLDPSPADKVLGSIDIERIDPHNPEHIFDISTQILTNMNQALSK